MAITKVALQRDLESCDVDAQEVRAGQAVERGRALDLLAYVGDCGRANSGNLSVVGVRPRKLFPEVDSERDHFRFLTKNLLGDPISDPPTNPTLHLYTPAPHRKPR